MSKPTYHRCSSGSKGKPAHRRPSGADFGSGPVGAITATSPVQR